MAMTTVFFEDVPVTLGGAQFLASGEIDISYKMVRADRSVGELYDYPEVDFPTQIVATLTDEDGEETIEIIADYREGIFQEIVAKIEENAVDAAERDARG